MRPGGHASLLILILLVGTLLPPPPAAAQDARSTPTTLYLHIFDTFNKFPINTQPMDVEFFDVGGTNFPTSASMGYDFNTIYGYSTPGPVEYDFIENGRPRYHPERGIAEDVLIDGAVQPTAYVYMDVRDLIGDTVAPMGMPAFTVRVTVREGDDFGDEAKLDEGRLLMSGQLHAHLADTRALNAPLAGQSAPEGTPILVPDEEGVIEFVIPLDTSADRIPAREAFNVRIDWWQDPAGALGDDEFSTGYVRLVADERHLPRLELAVLNPIRVAFLHPQVAAGILMIHAGIVSPWGTYDVDVSNATLEIRGPAQPKALETVIAQHAHVHNMHDAEAEITWVWRFRDEAAPSGTYEITLTIPNLQGTASATSTATFRVEGPKAYGVSDTGEVVAPLVDEGGDARTPAPVALAFLAAAGAAVALRRRRAA